MNSLSLCLVAKLSYMYTMMHNTLDESFDNRQTPKWILEKDERLGHNKNVMKPFPSQVYISGDNFFSLFARRSSHFRRFRISLQLECIHLEFSPSPVFGFPISHRKWSNLFEFIWFLLSNWRDTFFSTSRMWQVEASALIQYWANVYVSAWLSFLTELIRICCADANFCSVVIISEFASVHTSANTRDIGSALMSIGAGWHWRSNFINLVLSCMSRKLFLPY